jgi:hypothetical protein
MSRKAMLVALVVLVLGAGLWLRTYLSPSNVIKRSFLSAVAAFEEEQLLATLHVIDRAYRDELGQSYESLAGNIRLLHETYDRLELSLDPPSVQVEDDQARMEIRFVLWGSFEGQRGTILGTAQAPCSATLEWSERPQGWRLTSATGIRVPELQDEIDRRRRQR